MKRAVLRLLDPLLQSQAVERLMTFAVQLWSSGASRLSPEEGLRRLLTMDDVLQKRIDGAAIDLDCGVHAKHRLTGYHDFFVQRVRPGERVLDVGCGKGELAHDLVLAGARVTGIDVSRPSLEYARAHYGDDGLELVEGDVLTWDPPYEFDVVVLSNVLEHVALRVELLHRLQASVRPSRFIVRVPSRERDWVVPLREHLGLEHFSDPTHQTEYTLDQLRSELSDAGLELVEVDQRWGELWAVARAADPPEGGAILA